MLSCVHGCVVFMGLCVFFVGGVGVHGVLGGVMDATVGFVGRLTRRPTKPTVAPITPSRNVCAFSKNHCRATPSH